MNPTEFKIILHDVMKQYRGRMVLDGVNLEVSPGEVVGLIGPNGCGKTTLLRIVAGLVQASQGHVWINGRDLREEPDRVAPDLGVLFDPPGFLPQFTGYQNLSMLARIRRVIDSQGVRQWMQRVRLDPADPQKVGTYSQGMVQRLGLAQALMENPQVLLLDEPTNALDPKSVDLVAELIRDQQNQGAAILVASHHLEEVARVCSRVFKVDDGHLTPATDSDLTRQPNRVPQ